LEYEDEQLDAKEKLSDHGIHVSLGGNLLIYKFTFSNNFRMAPLLLSSAIRSKPESVPI
jgi:hypothetical protein